MPPKELFYQGEVPDNGTITENNTLLDGTWLGNLHDKAMDYSNDNYTHPIKGSYARAYDGLSNLYDNVKDGALGWLPGLGDVTDAVSIADDVNKGNYGSAAMTAGLMFLPGSAGKYYRAIKDITNKNTFLNRLTHPITTLKLADVYSRVKQNPFISDIRVNNLKQHLQNIKFKNRGNIIYNGFDIKGLKPFSVNRKDIAHEVGHAFRQSNDDLIESSNELIYRENPGYIYGGKSIKDDTTDYYIRKELEADVFANELYPELKYTKSNKELKDREEFVKDIKILHLYKNLKNGGIINYLNLFENE